MKTIKNKTANQAVITPPGNANANPNQNGNNAVDDWKINGWLNRTKTGKSITVSMMDENGESVLLGFINLNQIKRLMDGEINGTPIKCPNEIKE